MQRRRNVLQIVKLSNLLLIRKNTSNLLLCLLKQKHGSLLIYDLMETRSFLDKLSFKNPVYFSLW